MFLILAMGDRGKQGSVSSRTARAVTQKPCLKPPPHQKTQPKPNQNNTQEQQNKHKRIKQPVARLNPEQATNKL